MANFPFFDEYGIDIKKVPKDFQPKFLDLFLSDEMKVKNLKMYVKNIQQVHKLYIMRILK